MLNYLILAGVTYFFKAGISKAIIGSPDHQTILFWAFCATFFSGVSFYYFMYFKNTERAKEYVIYTIVGNIMNFVLSLFLVAYVGVGVIGIVYAELCSGLLVFGILSYKFARTFEFGLNRTIFRDSLKLSYPLTPRIVVGIIGSQSDKYLIGLLASVGGVGMYSIGQKVSYMITRYMTAMYNVFSPRVYETMFEGSSEGGKVIGRLLTPFLYISIAVGFLVSLFSEEMIWVVTPPSYHGAIDIVAILCVYYGLLFFGMVGGIQLLFSRKSSIISAISIVSICLTIGANVICISKWGAIGAAWGTLFAGVLSGAMYFAAAQRYYEIKWEYGKVMGICLTFVGGAFMGIFLRYVGLDYSFRILAKVVWVCLYVYIGITSGVITYENMAMVRKVLKEPKIRDTETVSTYAGPRVGWN
jgi:O-antigen/teichoic acid export membrane protein